MQSSNSAIRDLKEGAGADHIPSGHYHANAAWLACAVLAHNLGCWSTQLARAATSHEPNQTHPPHRRFQRSSSTVPAGPCCASPARWPWARAFNTVLNAPRALPGPSR